MKEFSALDLQRQSSEVQRSAAMGPVVILNHGKPRSVLMSVEEFRRLMVAAGQSLPREVMTSRRIVRHTLPKDAFGYATADLRSLALTMAEAALSHRNRDAVRTEIKAAERRLGLL